ncbi:uncharacterized protein [Rutidosis leptorrhynchoides]|uniref:uncharacterized protein n=1 Tax=Rutidosis leptorrhynchoides TaxID=125765 RepID=UPI003A9A2309
MGQIVCHNSATGLKIKDHNLQNMANEVSSEKMKKNDVYNFQMPLHYPRYKKEDYEKMPEWKLDCLLKEYGLPTDIGDVHEKRKFAMGAFLWT